MKKYIILVLIAVFISSGISFFMNKTMQAYKLGWVNIHKVYDDFVFKKELETKLTQTQQARKAIIDSLEFELKVLSQEIKSEEGKDKKKIAIFESKREYYINKKNELEEDNTMLQKQYNEQIVNQLNQYLKNYGKEKKLRYIFGTDGNGSLMYALEADEITEDAINYVNEQYKGKTE
jgi:outer membrane protein